VRRALRGQLKEIRQYQLKMIWRDHVSRVLKGRRARESAEVRARQRELVAALSEHDNPVPVSKIALLTPPIARAYATRTRKMLTRDLNALRDLGCQAASGRRGSRVRSKRREFDPTRALEAGLGRDGPRDYLCLRHPSGGRRLPLGDTRSPSDGARPEREGTG
jgi:hypothetical protein